MNIHVRNQNYTARHLRRMKRRHHRNRKEPSTKKAWQNCKRPTNILRKYDLPAMCHSEPITHHHNVNAQVDELLEEWPRRVSCFSANTQDWQSLCKQLQPKVTFSERSILHVYWPDPLYVRNKSYTKTDRKNFSSETLSEAMRIK